MLIYGVVLYNNMNTTTQTKEQELEKLIEQVNQLDGETTVKFLEMYNEPKLFYGLLNNRDHLVDQALVRQGKITQTQAGELYLKREATN